MVFIMGKGIQYTTVTSDKRKVVALILVILLGWMGAHRYYVGRLRTGILYTCTLGFFFIGAILDFIAIITGGFKDNVGAPLRR